MDSYCYSRDNQQTTCTRAKDVYGLGADGPTRMHPHTWRHHCLATSFQVMDVTCTHT